MYHRLELPEYIKIRKNNHKVHPTIELFSRITTNSFCTGCFNFLIGVFPKWNRNSLNSGKSGNLINHWSMNWAQFKDRVFHMCLADAMVASSSPFTVMTIIFVTLSLNSANPVKTLRENSIVSHVYSTYAASKY